MTPQAILLLRDQAHELEIQLAGKRMELSNAMCRPYCARLWLADMERLIAARSPEQKARMATAIDEGCYFTQMGDADRKRLEAGS